MKFIIHDLLKVFPGKSNVGALGLSSAALIIAGDKKILFDTGSHGVKPTLMKSLDSLGVKADEIDAIFLSHLHYDHSENVTMFPNAKLFVGQKEWEYANEVCDIFTPRENLEYLKSRNIEFITEDNQKVLEGMRAILTPGHTPGHMSLVLEADEGTWVMAGDAVKNRGELELEKSDQFVLEAESKESIKRIKSISDRVLPGHDCWASVKDGHVFAESDVVMDITLAKGIEGGENGLFRLNIDK